MQRPANEIGEPYEPLLEDLRNLKDLIGKSSAPGDFDAEVRTLRTALTDLESRDAVFRHLAMSWTRYTVALVDDLVDRAVDDGDFGNVAELLGRLAYDEAQKIVPPAVWRRLEADDADDHDWYRMADLLHYLGLYDTLRELIAKARDHIDGDVRGVVDAYPDF